MQSINQWAEDDRPREKLMNHGAEALSTAELLAILIGSGSTNKSAVDLMKEVLGDCGNSLAALSRMSLQSLMKYKGIGMAKAVTIAAACELGKRREKSAMPEHPKLNSADEIYKHLCYHTTLRDSDVEEAFVVLMNHNFRHISTVRLSHGGLTETAVDVRLIMKEALQANATIIALAHNHPSGNVTPSGQDDKLTQQVSNACKIMRILLADHLIVTDGKYYSYSDHGRL